MLELKNLSFAVQSDAATKEIIHDISLTVGKGKFVVITGPNGGGKSTLAKLIAGIDLWSFKSLIEVFERMRSANSERTILVISHQERILNIADEIIVLGGGQIMAHGSKDEILPTLLGTSAAVSACGQLTKGGEQ